MKANEAGIPIFTVSSKNIDQVLPQLQVSEYVKTDIQNAVNKGHIVTIPKSNITLNDWNGTGYVVLEPDTGAAAYMISGGMAGGATTAIIFLAAIAAAIIAIVDVLFAASVLVTLSVYFIGAFLAAWVFSLVVLALVSVLDDILNHYVYHTEDNSEAFISDAIWGLVTLGLLGFVKVVGKYLISLLKGAKALSKAGEEVVRLTRSAQGSDRYPGIDDWTYIILPKGTKIWGGTPGQSNFYTNEKTLQIAGNDAKKIFEGLQVGKTKEFPHYRQFITDSTAKTLKNLKTSRINSNVYRSNN